MDDLYNHAELYDQVTNPSARDVAFWAEEAQRLNGPVLELACGTGRILNIVAEKSGLPCTGLDLSPSMLARAKTKAPHLEYILGDLRNFNLGRKFKFIFVGLNSLGHIHDWRDFGKFLVCVRNHLEPNGELGFQIHNPSPAMLSRRPVDRFFVGAFNDFKVEETTRYDLSTQVSHTTWYYSKPGQPDFYIHDFKLRAYFPQELQALLDFNAFKVTQTFGDHSRKPFESQDMLQIIFAKPDCRT
jgi:SAM-dependent methyltransferase